MTIILIIWLVGVPFALVWLGRGSGVFAILFALGWPITLALFGWTVLNDRVRRTP